MCLNMHVEFHVNACSGLGEALTKYVDRRTDGWTDRVIPIYPPNFVGGDIITVTQ